MISKCVDQDIRAQLEMHEHCFKMLMPVCYKFVKNEEMARELYNQGFLKILDALKYFDKEKDFSQWAKRIMMNKLIDDYRSKKSLRKLIDENLEPDYASNTLRLKEENSYISQAEEERVNYLLEKLPETTRRVFRLFALEGYSHQEISELMKMSTGTSKWHVSNARHLLKEFITKKLNPVSHE
ncbi:MAG: RNA polymerase sigma factor [Flavobacteriales bacterium]